MLRSAAFLAVLTATLGTAEGAFADDKLTCVAAADAAQQQRTEGKLREARTSLHVCAREVCPPIVRNDCTQWLAEVEATVPTIVLRAQNARGQDLTDVRIRIDNEAVAEKLDGLPIEIDPGQHVVTGERAGSKPLRQEIVINTGERNRTVSVVLEDAESAGGGGVVGALPPSSAPRRLTPAVGILGGVAVAALGSFTYFGLRGSAEVAAMRAPGGCAPSCTTDDVNPARNKLIVADISLGVGLISAGVATYLFLSSPKQAAATSVGRRGIGVIPVAGGVAATWSERF
jgi:hypothetical protein